MVATFDLIHDMPTPLEGLQILLSSLNKDDVFLSMDMECTNDPMENDGPFTLFKLGISLHFSMTRATRQGGNGMGTMDLSPSVLSGLCEKGGFRQINKIAINHPHFLL